MRVLAFAVMLVFMNSCSTLGKTVDVNSLTSLLGSNWQLSSLSGIGDLSEAFNGGLPTLSFSEDEKVTGNDGCNNFNGKVSTEELSKGKLNLGTMASTMMACDFSGPNKMREVFANTSSFNLKDDKLQLLSAGESVLAEFLKK